MCCVCLKTSRHSDSVQCDACLACAHCKCAGFRTYAEAAESNALFFCRACDLFWKNREPRPSPIRPPSSSPHPVNGPSPKSVSSPSPTLASSALSPISYLANLANSPLSRSLFTTPVRVSATQPPEVSPSVSIGVTPNGRRDSPTQPQGASTNEASVVFTQPSQIFDSQQSIPMLDPSIPVSPNGRPPPSPAVDRIPDTQPHHLDHDYDTVPSLMSLNIPPPAIPPPLPAPLFHPDLPSLDDVLETLITTLEHIPRACRDSCAASLTSLITKAVSDPTSYNYRLILMFPKAVLFSPIRGGRNSSRNLVATILDRLRRWSQGHFIPLWNEARDNQAKIQRRTRRRNNNPSKDFGALRAEKLARSGQYGRAIQALSSSGLADDTEEVFEALTAKHPQGSPPTLPPGPPPDSIPIPSDTVKSAVLSFNVDTAPGPSGMKANYLKDLFSSPNANQRQAFFHALTSFVNSMNRGHVPPEIRPYFFSATLHAAKKKQGGIRPIACGEVFSRLTAKCLAFILAEDAAAVFSPFQLGVKVRNGCEAALHAVSALLHSPSPIADRYILQVDLTNAFNNIDRSHFLSETRNLFPALSSWAELSYGSPSHLYFKGRKLQSSVGTKQGDPTAGMLFATGLHPTILKINTEVPNLMANIWIMDDGTISGSLDALRKTVSILVEDGPSRGLLLNKDKCRIWVGDDFPTNPDPLGCGIPKSDPRGIFLLGSPVGTPDFMEFHVNQRISKIKETVVERLPSIEDPQVKLCILRSCLSLPKLVYTLRTCKPSSLKGPYDRFDVMQHLALEEILGCSLTPSAWRQASLPVSLGGLGLRSASSHASAAFLSSIIGSEQIVDEILGNFPFRNSVDAPLAIFRTAAGSLPPAVIANLSDPSGDFSQKRLSHLVDSNVQSTLIQEFQSNQDHRAVARLLSLGLPMSGAFLNAIPSHIFGLSIIPENFRLILQYRLGLPVYVSSHSCPACGQDSDILGDHTITCASEFERIYRHDIIRDAIFLEAKHAGLSPIKEARSLIPNSQTRPGDFFLQNWRGRQTAFDVAVTSPLGRSVLPRSSKKAGAALETMKASKINKHARPCQANGIAFIPLVVETLGGWDSDALFHLRAIAKQTAARSATQAPVVIRQFFQRLSVLLQRSNAALIAARAPAPPPPYIIGT